MTAVSTIKPDDILHVAHLLDAALSPDGSRAVYSVSTVAEAAMADTCDIRVADVVTGECRQLTAPGAFEHNAAWSPDGRRIAFRSTRSGLPQLHVIAVDGGEATAVTAMAQGVGVSGPTWSPDGSRLAFTAGPAERRDPTAPYRVTRPLWRLDEIGYVEDALQELYVVDVDGGEPRQVTDHRSIVMFPQWSPDGTELLYVTIAEPDSMTFGVRVVTVETGEQRTIFSGDFGGFPATAAWLPDGRIVYADMPPIPDPIHLWVCDGDGGNAERRTEGLEGTLFGLLQPDFPFAFLTTRIVVRPDGAAAYVFAQVGGTLEVREVALTGPTSIRTVVSGEQASVPYDVAGDRLLIGTTTMHSPLDLFTTDLGGGDVRRLTQLNGDRFGDEHFTIHRLAFPGEDGVEVEGWYLAPHGGEAPHPTVLNIHGGPFAGFGHLFSFDNQLFVGAGYGVLIVNQRASTGYGEAFARGIIGDWGHLDYTDLMAGVDAAVREGLADPDRLGSFGISGGGYLTSWIVTHTDRFKAGIAESPLTNFLSWATASDLGPVFCPAWVDEPLATEAALDKYTRFSPLTFARDCTTPTLLIQHESDARTPPDQSEQFYAVLHAVGCPTEMLRIPNSFHGGSVNLGNPRGRLAQNEALVEWMNRWIPER